MMEIRKRPEAQPYILCLVCFSVVLMGRETGLLQLLAPNLLTGGKWSDLMIRGNVVLNTNIPLPRPCIHIGLVHLFVSVPVFFSSPFVGSFFNFFWRFCKKRDSVRWSLMKRWVVLILVLFYFDGIQSVWTYKETGVRGAGPNWKFRWFNFFFCFYKLRKGILADVYYGLKRAYERNPLERSPRLIRANKQITRHRLVVCLPLVLGGSSSDRLIIELSSIPRGGLARGGGRRTFFASCPRLRFDHKFTTWRQY
jgi:hypothetical protein